MIMYIHEEFPEFKVEGILNRVCRCMSTKIASYLLSTTDYFNEDHGWIEEVSLGGICRKKKCLHIKCVRRQWQHFVRGFLKIRGFIDSIVTEFLKEKRWDGVKWFMEEGWIGMDDVERLLSAIVC